MKKSTLVCLLTVSVGLVVVEPAITKATGIFPFTQFGRLNVGPLTRASSQSCGQCHRATTNAPPRGVTVSVAPTARVLSAGASTSVTVKATSTVTSSSGGFVSDVTTGSLVAGTSTKVNPAGNAITHFKNAVRAWTFTYKASATPGLAEMYVVGLNGNSNTPVLLPDIGDEYAFHGSSPTNTVSTPVRFYANAPGFKAVGESCSDGFGNFSVLGGKTPPKIGTTFLIEGAGMPPSSPMLFMMGLGTNLPPVDLGFMGAPGCVLRQTMQFQIALATSGGNASRAEGGFALPIPVPNDQALKGFGFTVQFGMIDSNSTRAFPFTVTNGLEVTLQ